MKTLLTGFLLLISFNLRAGENLYNTNISYGGFDPFSIPFPLALDFKSEFYYGLPFDDLNVTEANIYPSLVVAPAKDRQIISLTKTKELGANNQLITANPEDGYLYIRKKKLEMGIGLNLTTNGSPEIIGSLLPYYGSETTELRIVKSKEKDFLKDLKTLERPVNLEIFNSWKVGEQLSYFKKGGVIFYPSYNFSIVSVGAGFSAEGVWKVVLSKLSNNELLVEVRKYQLKSLKTGVSAIAPSLGLIKYWRFDNEFSFVFNLQNPDVFPVMENLLGGNIKKAQELADNNDNSFVTYLKNNKRYTNGRNLNLKFAIPAFFSASFNLSEETEKELIFNPAEDIKSVIYTGENSRVANTSGVLSRDYTRFITFDAKVTENTQLSNLDRKDIFTGAHYRYLYKRDNMDSKTLKNQIWNLYKRVGFKNQIDLSIPTEGKFGELGFKFDMLYYPSGMQKLMEKSEITEEQLLGMVNNKIDGYFLDQEKAKYLCGIIDKLKSCKKSYKLLSKIRIKAAVKYLANMKQEWANKKHESLAKSFSRFGKNLTNNLFLTDLLLDLYGRENVKAKFTVRGSDFASYEKLLTI